jgi:hypothetical protein
MMKNSAAEKALTQMVSSDMSGFIEHMGGDPSSELFQITNDLDDYDPFLLQHELMQILDIHDPKNDQVHISNVPGHEDDTRFCYGSLVYDHSKQVEEIQADGTKKWIPIRRENPVEETEFTSTSTIFKGTVFEEIQHLLSSKYNMGRFRVMIQQRSSCLSWHLDAQPRLHYPIKTQKGCFMIVNGEIRHLIEGETYFVDTTNYHTAVNASREIRIHLVANILK